MYHAIALCEGGSPIFSFYFSCPIRPCFSKSKIVLRQSSIEMPVQKVRLSLFSLAPPPMIFPHTLSPPIIQSPFKILNKILFRKNGLLYNNPAYEYKTEGK
jgi:hypothetical protein